MLFNESFARETRHIAASDQNKYNAPQMSNLTHGRDAPGGARGTRWLCRRVDPFDVAPGHTHMSPQQLQPTCAQTPEVSLELPPAIQPFSPCSPSSPSSSELEESPSPEGISSASHIEATALGILLLLPLAPSAVPSSAPL